MSYITRSLPWFIQDLGVAIVGQVSPFLSSPIYSTNFQNTLS